VQLTQVTPSFVTWTEAIRGLESQGGGAVIVIPQLQRFPLPLTCWWDCPEQRLVQLRQVCVYGN
jgi:hypothetical protein